jgi:hypothetical protein
VSTPNFISTFESCENVSSCPAVALWPSASRRSSAALCFQAADFFEAVAPFGERGVGEEGGECRIVNRLDLRRDERRKLADPREQILELRLACEVRRVGRILRAAQRCVVVDFLDEPADALVALQQREERRGGFADLSAEFREDGIFLLQPREVGGPLAGGRVKRREIPRVLGPHFGACGDSGTGVVIVEKEREHDAEQCGAAQCRRGKNRRQDECCCCAALCLCV